MKPEKIDVIAYSGYKAEERPKKFIYKGKTFHIKKILNRSLKESIPDLERNYHFQVQCMDQQTFTIFYNIKQDQWFIEV